MMIKKRPLRKNLQKKPGAVTLRENDRRDDDRDDRPEESYDEGEHGQSWNDWNEDDWQGYESRGYERERSQRRSKGHEKGYEKGKGKGRSKSKSKGKDKGKPKGSYYRSWWTPPRISAKDLMEKLLKKGNRHQAEWNKWTWETLKSEDGEELISVRVCVKKSPRHTSMNVPPERRYWRKFSVEHRRP